MLTKLKSATLIGLDACLIDVEVDSIRGLPGQTIVGLPDTAVKESRDRVKMAIVNSDFEYPPGYFTINLAPADIRKVGPMYDLPMALGILACSGQIGASLPEDTIFLGELSLDGSIRPISGLLPICSSAKNLGIKKALVPKVNAPEAALVPDIEVIPVENLKQAADYLSSGNGILPYKVDLEEVFRQEQKYEVDFVEVKGQAWVKRALEISAAGMHNLIMVGPPGIGKTMLACRLPTIMPPLDIDEALEVTKIYSLAGKLSGSNFLVKTRPFRSPHHTASHISLVGGGKYPNPGEISLAHFGVLFMDELPEFNRNVLEVLRQPIEEGNINISRVSGTVNFPAQFLFIAAMNPCPCGFFGDPYKKCICSTFQIQRYWEKLSGPLLDRIDLQIEVPRLKIEDYSGISAGDSSRSIRERVVRAHNIQQSRFEGTACRFNAKMGAKLLKIFCVLDKEAEEFLKQAIYKLKLSGRAYDKILKVSRTIADLAASETIKLEHIAEAVQYRGLDRRGEKLL